MTASGGAALKTWIVTPPGSVFEAPSGKGFKGPGSGPNGMRNIWTTQWTWIEYDEYENGQNIWMFTGFSWADSAIHPCFRLLEKVYDYIKHCQSQPASNPGSSPWHPQAQKCFLWLETICGKHRPCWSPAASSSTGLASLHRHVQKRQASTPVLALWYSLMWWSF